MDDRSASEHRGVLNAFRHHREEHPTRDERPTAHHPVLNAFRHHREEHDETSLLGLPFLV